MFIEESIFSRYSHSKWGYFPGYFDGGKPLRCVVLMVEQQIYQEMSSSLPRLRALSGPEGEAKPKFKRIMQGIAEQTKKPTLVFKTERLHSLEKYSTVEEQREYKREKIHLNLLQRKLLTGRYDEEKQTGNDLNTLKQKRDQFKVEAEIKRRETDRIKELTKDVRKELEVFEQRLQEQASILNEARERHDIQVSKTVAARETKGVLEHMIFVRKEINNYLAKQANQVSMAFEKTQSKHSMAQHELKEQTDKCSFLENKFQTLKEQIKVEKKEREDEMFKEQSKINRRTEQEIVNKEKSKEYIRHLDDDQREREEGEFRQIYDKILSHTFMRKYTSLTLLSLEEKYEELQHSYNNLAKYGHFNRADPSSFVRRFAELEPETKSAEEKVAILEKQLEQVQKRHASLQKMAADADIESAILAENWSRNESTVQLQRMVREKNETRERIGAVRRWVLKGLKMLDLKGERRQGDAAAVARNMVIIGEGVREELRKGTN